MKILVVEDEKDLNNIITKHLKKNNFSVDSVFDGEEALEYLNYGDYDVIILDIMLPKFNGYEVVKNLRANKNETAVLMLTARDAIDDKIKGLDLGADDYLVKPFTYERFSQAIDKVQDYVNLLSKEKINQDLIDDYLNSGRVEEEEDSLPKGLSRITLKKVIEAIQQQNTGFTTQQIADILDISRITIRKYLNHLVNIKVLGEDAEYYTSGRPVSVFTVESESKLEKLL